MRLELRTVRRGPTLVLPATHDAAAVDRADHVLALTAGRALAPA